MKEIEQAGFEFSPLDLQMQNVPTECGGMTADTELQDDLEAVLEIARRMVVGSEIAQVWATPEGALASSSHPDKLNIELVLSNGMRLVVMGEWRIKIAEQSQVASLSQ